MFGSTYSEDDLYTAFTVQEIIDELESSIASLEEMESETEELEEKIAWIQEFDPDDCDVYELEDYNEEKGSLESYIDELEYLDDNMREMESYIEMVEEIVQRVCGVPKFYVLTQNNHIVSGPHYVERPVLFPNKLVKVYPNSIFMSEQILEEERNARQWEPSVW